MRFFPTSTSVKPTSLLTPKNDAWDSVADILSLAAK
jgi:hypothetical protein